MINPDKEELQSIKQPEIVVHPDRGPDRYPDLELSSADEITPSAQVVLQASALVGQVIGGYRLLSIIGYGGMGTVFKARHLLLGHEVAFKLLSPDRFLDDESIRRFRQEASMLERLQSPHIVAFREFNLHTDGRPYLVAELASGVTLAEKLSTSGRLSRRLAARIGVDICEGLAAAHRQGVVHRDLKPSNVILSQDERQNEVARLLDFGIAKSVINADTADGRNSLTKSGQLIGSPMYMSPEQCKGLSVDQRTDIYALGCLLFECVNGQPPFAGQSLIETLANHMGRECPLLESGNSLLDQIVSRCLAKDPQQRYQSVREVKDLLLQVIAGKGEEDLAGKRRRSLRTTALVGLVGLAVLGVMAIAAKQALSIYEEQKQLAPVYKVDFVANHSWLWPEGAMRKPLEEPSTELKVLEARLQKDVENTNVISQLAKKEVALARLLEKFESFDDASTHFDKASSQQKASDRKGNPEWMVAKAEALRCRYEAVLGHLVLFEQLGYERENLLILAEQSDKLIKEIQATKRTDLQSVLRALYVLRGNALFLLRDFGLASTQFQTALDIPELPNTPFASGSEPGVILARWADCERANGHLKKAAALYDSALTEFLTPARLLLAGPDDNYEGPEGHLQLLHRLLSEDRFAQICTNERDRQNIAYALAMSNLLLFDDHVVLADGTWNTVERTARAAYGDFEANDNSRIYGQILDAVATRQLLDGDRRGAKELRKEVRATNELYP